MVVSTVERADLQAALERLSESERALLAMRYEEDLTQAAIAARLGIPEGTVKVQPAPRARSSSRRAYAGPSDRGSAPVHAGERDGPKFGPLDKDARRPSRRLFGR